MKRDLDLIRNILIQAKNFVPKPAADDWSANYGDSQLCTNKLKTLTSNEELIIFNLKLMREGKLIKIFGSPSIYLDSTHIEITPQGIDFLDVIYDKDIWESAKKIIDELGGSLPFSIVQSICEKLIRQKLGV